MQTATRLATQFENRQIGTERDLLGNRKPVFRTYHIGHGQQLARKRLADLPSADPSAPNDRPHKARKAKAKQAERDRRLAEVKDHRARSAPALKAAAERQEKVAEARRVPHPQGDLKFLNRGARLRVAAERLARMSAEIDAEDAKAKPARKSRAKKAAA